MKKSVVNTTLGLIALATMSFAASHALMAQALPPAQVDRVAGDHAWPVWRQLWERFLEREFGHD